MRGIAATIVLISHIIWSLWPKDVVRLLWLPPVSFIASGHQAVILFFVLSGFSLFLMFESMRDVPHSPSKFIAARWVRLYPVYFLSMVFSISVYWLLRHENVAWPSDSFPAVRSFELRDVLQHAMLIGVFDPNQYNPVLWSIVLEMRISMLFPLIYFLVLRFQRATLIAAISFSWVVAIATLNTKSALGFDGLQTVTLSAISTVYHSTFFVLGASLAKHRTSLTIQVTSMSRGTVVAGLVACLGLYSYSLLVWIGQDSFTLGRLILCDSLAGAGSCGLILLALAFPILGKSAALRGLGKISYSLYLVHFTFLEGLVVLLVAYIPIFVLVGMIFVLSVTASTVMWKFVDIPAIEFSRVVRKRGSLRAGAAARLAD